MNKYLLITILSILSFAGCKKADNEKESDKLMLVREYLTGTWQCSGTSGGITGQTIGPSEDCTMQLEFSGNNITLLKNGESIFTSKYLLQETESIYSSGKVPCIVLPGHEWPLMIEDVLVSGVLMVSIDNSFPPHFTIGDNMYDGYGSHFFKNL